MNLGFGIIERVKISQTSTIKELAMKIMEKYGNRNISLICNKRFREWLIREFNDVAGRKIRLAGALSIIEEEKELLT